MINDYQSIVFDDIPPSSINVICKPDDDRVYIFVRFRIEIKGNNPGEPYITAFYKTYRGHYDYLWFKLSWNQLLFLYLYINGGKIMNDEKELKRLRLKSDTDGFHGNYWRFFELRYIPDSDHINIAMFEKHKDKFRSGILNKLIFGSVHVHEALQLSNFIRECIKSRFTEEEILIMEERAIEDYENIISWIPAGWDREDFSCSEKEINMMLSFEGDLSDKTKPIFIGSKWGQSGSLFFRLDGYDTVKAKKIVNILQSGIFKCSVSIPKDAKSWRDIIFRFNDDDYDCKAICRLMESIQNEEIIEEEKKEDDNGNK